MLRRKHLSGLAMSKLICFLIQWMMVWKCCWVGVSHDLFRGDSVVISCLQLAMERLCPSASWHVIESYGCRAARKEGAMTLASARVAQASPSPSPALTLLPRTRNPFQCPYGGDMRYNKPVSVGVRCSAGGCG